MSVDTTRMADGDRRSMGLERPVTQGEKAYGVLIDGRRRVMARNLKLTRQVAALILRVPIRLVRLETVEHSGGRSFSDGVEVIPELSKSRREG